MFSTAFLIFLSTSFRFYCYILLFTILIIVLICALWVCSLTLFFDIHIGEPSLKELNLAYKYSYNGRSSSACYKKLHKQYPDYKLVKLCYSGPKSSHIEYANGVVISELDAYFFEHLLKNGLSFFKTPCISHTISASYPTVPWLPFTKWIAVAIAYTKLFKYVKEYNLCAYPVMEIYSKSSVSVIIPLLRQDEFVVKEAERLVNGRQHSAMLSPLSISSYYVPEGKKYSKLTSSPRVTKGERKG